MFYERVEIICNDLGIAVTEQWLYIVVSEQRMYYYDRDRLKTSYRISTAKKGIGQIEDSEQTPLGLHKIEEKIGGGAPWGMVFISRKRTGKIFTEYSDWQSKCYVTSRILRLKGLQEGYNLGTNCDTFKRYIYIHGVTNEQKIGTPWTRGCIGMCNDDVMELFQQIDVGTLVWIRE